MILLDVDNKQPLTNLQKEMKNVHYMMAALKIFNKTNQRYEASGGIVDEKDILKYDNEVRLVEERYKKAQLIKKVTNTLKTRQERILAFEEMCSSFKIDAYK